MRQLRPRPLRILLAALLVGAGCARTAPAPSAPEPGGARPPRGLVPLPANLEWGSGNPFQLGAGTGIVVSGGSPEALRVGAQLAAALRPATGFALPVAPEEAARTRGISLRLAPEAALGEEGYRLAVSADSVLLSAATPQGLFRGTQTLRQLLPATVEAGTSQPGPWTVPAVRIEDRPRFAWRGAMLDVARHFFSVDEVKRYIDLLALYKINRLHLHLADDQGWRVMIESWPRLALHGGATEVGGTPGGYYSQAEYSDLVRYAADRYITVVPEIDMPGHTNAALASYAELNCNDTAPAPYTGIEVGFSSLCVDREVTYRFVDDVVRELAALTPGPYFHIGGDEVETLTPEAYAGFVQRVQEIVARHGKRAVGWEEIAHAPLLPTTLVQYWKSDSTQAARAQGARLILSPASRVYLDMKYDSTTALGLDWAGLVEVRDAYDWDPADWAAGEGAVVGVEAPLWSETLEDIRAVEYMAFPRLPAVAEIGWTPAAARDWDEFRWRLAAQQARWEVMEVNFYRSPQVPWER